MLWRRLLAGAVLAAVTTALAPAAGASNIPRGPYVCTIEQTAGIGAEMMEGSDPPKAFIDKTEARFRIVVSPRVRGKARVEERAIGKAKAFVLRGAYFGDGWKFAPAKDQAFLRLDFIGEAGWLWFYHAGFEKPDIDHLNLSVRSGPCEPDK